METPFFAVDPRSVGSPSSQRWVSVRNIARRGRGFVATASIPSSRYERAHRCATPRERTRQRREGAT